MIDRCGATNISPAMAILDLTNTSVANAELRGDIVLLVASPRHSTNYRHARARENCSGSDFLHRMVKARPVAPGNAPAAKLGLIVDRRRRRIATHRGDAIFGTLL